MAKVLTSAAVAKFRPTGEKRIIRDAGARSLYLIVEPSGAKSWMMRFRRPDGKPAKMVIGSVDLSGREVEGEPTVGMPLSLSAARQLAAQIHRERALGRDVVADHKAKRHRHRASENAFAAIGREFVQEHARPKTRRWRETAVALGFEPESLELRPGGLAERWADRPVAEIGGHDVFEAIEESRRHGIPGRPARNLGPSEARGRALLAQLSSLFGWALRRRLVDSNPCAGLHRPPPPRARERVLSSAEIVKFWRATDEVGAAFGAVLKLLLLTGARLNEVARLQWDEVSEDGTQINLSGSRTKNHRAFALPLSDLARSIIASVPRIAGCDHVFTTNSHVPINGLSKVKLKLDRAMGDPPPWCTHDLRRTCVTGMSELGIAPHIVELVVNHVSGARAGVAGVYNRSEMMSERRSALERWAAHISGLVEGRPDNVVPIGRAS